MARKKWVIDERIRRTPEQRKWVEEQLNKERTPEELKEKILSPTCTWSVSFNKGISKRFLTCLVEPEIYWKEIEEERDYGDSHFSEIKRAIIDQIKQSPQDWKIEEHEIWEIIKSYETWKTWKEKTKSGRFKDMVVTNSHKGYKPVYDTNGCYLYTDDGHKYHYKNGFTEEEWTEIENALGHNKNNAPIIRKCGFSDCEKRIGWKKTECNNCWTRKENFICDACCQKQNYNISLLIGVPDFVNDTEFLLKSVRGLIGKLPKFYDKLKEIEKSLILTDEEKKAEKKNHSFRIIFLQERNGGRQRDNIHLFKLCRKCLDELAGREKKFFSENPDVKKIGEKWESNKRKHHEIFKQIAREVGIEEWKKVCDENNKELGLEVEEEKNSEKEKLPERWPTPPYQEEGVWEMLEGCIKGENDNNLSQEQKRDDILNYFKQYNIKSIKLKGNNLIIEYNTQQKETKEINNSELEKIKSFAEILGKSELSISDLEKSNNQSNSPNSNKTLYIGLTIMGILIIGIAAYLLLRKNKEK